MISIWDRERSYKERGVFLFCPFQVFVELAKEQEEEDSSFGTLNSTLWWERTQEDRVVF